MTNDERIPKPKPRKLISDFGYLNFFRHSSFVIRHFLALLLATSALAENWPCWRGPRLDGTSLEPNIPQTWSGESNIAWKVELPGVGHASPIVWNDRLFTVTALPDQQARLLLCLDRSSGKMLWQKTVLTAPMEKKHTLNSHASS